MSQPLDRGRAPARRSALARAAAITAIAAQLAACATYVETRPDWQATASHNALEGIPYTLPMAQFDLTVTRFVSSCPNVMQLVPEGETRPIVLVTGRLALGVKAESKTSYVQGERYLIDYEPLKTPFATTSFTVATYPTGVLKSINTSSDDQSATVVSQAAKLAFSVAGLTAGAPNVLAASKAGQAEDIRGLDQPYTEAEALHELATLAKPLPETTIVTCSADAVAWREAADANTKAQEEATATLDERTARVANATTVAGFRNADATFLTTLETAQADQQATKKKLADLVADRKKLDANLSASTRIVWPLEFDEKAKLLRFTGAGRDKFSNLLVAPRSVRVLPASLVAGWIKSVAVSHPEVAAKLAARAEFKGYLTPTGAAVLEPARDCANPQECLAKYPCEGAEVTLKGCVDSLDAHLTLQRASDVPTCKGDPGDFHGCRYEFTDISEGALTTPGGPHSAPPPVRPAALPAGRHARDLRADRGVFVRSSAFGKLLVCAGLIDGAKENEKITASSECKKSHFESEVTAMPQYGQLRFLPIRNEMFESSELSLTLREDGTLDTFGYKKTRAAAGAALTAANDLAGQYKTYKDGQETARKAERDRQLGELTFQIDMLTKQKALLALETPATPDAQKDIKDQTIQLNAEIALLNAERQKLEAQQNLAKAQATP